VVGHLLLLLLYNTFVVLSEGLCHLEPHEVVYLIILVSWFLRPDVLDGIVLRIAILSIATACSVSLLEQGFIL